MSATATSPLTRPGPTLWMTSSHLYARFASLAKRFPTKPYRQVSSRQFVKTSDFSLGESLYVLLALTSPARLISLRRRSCDRQNPICPKKKTCVPTPQPIEPPKPFQSCICVCWEIVLMCCISDVAGIWLIEGDTNKYAFAHTLAQHMCVCKCPRPMRVVCAFAGIPTEYSLHVSGRTQNVTTRRLE